MGVPDDGGDSQFRGKVPCLERSRRTGAGSAQGTKLVLQVSREYSGFSSHSVRSTLGKPLVEGSELVSGSLCPRIRLLDHLILLDLLGWSVLHVAVAIRIFGR